MKFRCALAAAAASMVGVWGPAAAQKTFTYGQWLPAEHNINVKALQPMIDELGTDMPWRLVIDSKLFRAWAALKSVGDRSAEAGLIVPSYTQADLKHAYILADMMILGKNELVMNAAGLDTLFFDCPECLGDYDKAGTVYLSGYGVGGYSLLCRKMVRSLADAKGLRIRATGVLDRWARALGATPVPMNMGDVPEAIKRGRIDCIIGPIAWLKSHPIEDSVKSVYSYGLGSYSTVGLMVMNREAWDSYSDAQKRRMWDVQPAAIARGMIDGYLGDDLKSRAMAKRLGIPITPGGPDVAPAWEKHKKNEIATVIKNARKLGVKNPERVVDAMLENLDKWTKIIADSGLQDIIAKAGLDADQLGPATEKYRRLLVEHIYSKIDPLKL